MKTNTVFVAVLFAAGLFLVGCIETPSPSGCAKDTKICPDGSSVQRVLPNCEFASCPLIGPSGAKVFLYTTENKYQTGETVTFELQNNIEQSIFIWTRPFANPVEKNKIWVFTVFQKRGENFEKLILETALPPNAGLGSSDVPIEIKSKGKIKGEWDGRAFPSTDYNAKYYNPTGLFKIQIIYYSTDKMNQPKYNQPTTVESNEFEIFPNSCRADSDCPVGFVCYNSAECGNSPNGSSCGLQLGDLQCHKKCDSNSDCPDNTPTCKNQEMIYGDAVATIKMCI